MIYSFGGVIINKINKPIACKYCQSSDVSFELLYKPEGETIVDEENGFKKTIWNKKYNCKCNNCNKNYIVDYGFDIYTKFTKTYKLDNCDVTLLAMYESNSDRSYQVVSVQGVYMIFCEDDEYPIVIPNENINELLSEPQLTKKLVFNKWLDRHK